MSSTQIHKGKWGVITGAASGIGKAIAHKCASLGINVVLIDIDETSLNSLKSEFSVKYPSVNALSYECDVSNEYAIKEMVSRFKTESCFDEKKPIIVHFLFNNAGVSSFTDVLTGDLKRMHKTMDINLWGMIYITQSFLPFMQQTSDNNKNDDRFIINTSSIAGLATGDSFYAVTKHGVCSLTETMRSELKYYNKKCQKEKNGRGVINVSCLVPSYVKSSFLETVGKVHNINVWDELQKSKTYNSGKPNPEFCANGLDPNIIAHEVFEQGIKQKLFWIHTHEEWSSCVSLDRFYSIYTQKFNQYEATRKIFKQYQENVKKIIDKQSKL